MTAISAPQQSCISKVKDCRKSRFLTHSDLPGISDLRKSKTWSRKTFWIIWILAALTMTSFMSFMEVESYIDAKVEASIMTQYDNNIKLPHLAVCDMGGLNLTKMVEEGIDSDVLLSSFLSPIFPKFNQSDLANLEDILRSYMNSKSITTINEFIRRFSYDCENILSIDKLSISYNAGFQACNQSKPWLFSQILFFNCYGIVSGHQTIPGVLGGPELTIDRPLDPKRDQLDRSSNGFGLEFFSASEPSEPKPLMLPYGVDAYISISKEKYTRLKKLSWPKGTSLCSDSNIKGGNCYFDCFGNITSLECGCVFIGSVPEASLTTPFCSPYQTINCSLLAYNFKFHKCQQICQPACESTDFTLYASYVPRAAKYTNSTVIHYGYATLSYSHMQETNAYTLIGLLSNIGGQISLWLGASLVTVVQTVMLCTMAYGDEN